jgi:pseudouridine-5'-monophosphatase
MDGLLIDSEDLYTICTNETLRKYGKPDLPWNIKAQLQGRPGPEVLFFSFFLFFFFYLFFFSFPRPPPLVLLLRPPPPPPPSPPTNNPTQAGRIFHEWAQLPITREDFLQQTSELQRKYFPSTKPLPGVPCLLSTLAANPAVHMALATSSHKANFHLKTAHLEQLFAVFNEENRVLGDDKRIPSGKGKPAPDIYLLALETINQRLRAEGQQEVTPAECLVFEDSVPGVESGRRAGMQVVWCPHPGLLEEYKGREGDVLAGASIVKQYGVSSGGEGVPGKEGDGWARLHSTLEGFPYESYGMSGVGNKSDSSL